MPPNKPLYYAQWIHNIFITISTDHCNSRKLPCTNIMKNLLFSVLSYFPLFYYTNFITHSLNYLKLPLIMKKAILNTYF